MRDIAWLLDFSVLGNAGMQYEGFIPGEVRPTLRLGAFAYLVTSATLR
jgi:hypothetical protein